MDRRTMTVDDGVAVGSVCIGVSESKPNQPIMLIDEGLQLLTNSIGGVEMEVPVPSRAPDNETTATGIESALSSASTSVDNAISQSSLSRSVQVIRALDDFSDSSLSDRDISDSESDLTTASSRKIHSSPQSSRNKLGARLNPSVKSRLSRRRSEEDNNDLDTDNDNGSGQASSKGGKQLSGGSDGKLGHFTDGVTVHFDSDSDESTASANPSSSSLSTLALSKSSTFTEPFSKHQRPLQRSTSPVRGRERGRKGPNPAPGDSPSKSRKDKQSSAQPRRRPGRPVASASNNQKSHNNSQSSNSDSGSDDSDDSTERRRQEAHRKKLEEDEMDPIVLYQVSGDRRPLRVSQIKNRDRSGRTPFFKFAGDGNLDACKKLLTSGADLHVQDNAGYSVLHEACLNGQLDVVKLLVYHGANVSISASNGDTSFHDAVENEHEDVAEFLLSVGASLDVKNNDGLTAMDTTEDENMLNLLRTWKSMMAMVSERTRSGETVIHRAAREGQTSSIKKFIKFGADVNCKDNAGWTPLHEACLSGSLECAKELLNYGAIVDTEGQGSETPLMDASENGHELIVQLLLEYGADAEKRNEKGLSANEVARTPACRELLERGDVYWKAKVKKPKFFPNMLIKTGLLSTVGLRVNQTTRDLADVYPTNSFKALSNDHDESQISGDDMSERRKSVTSALAGLLPRNAGPKYSDYWGGLETLGGSLSKREQQKLQAALRKMGAIPLDEPLLPGPKPKQKSGNDDGSSSETTRKYKSRLTSQIKSPMTGKAPSRRQVVEDTKPSRRRKSDVSQSEEEGYKRPRVSAASTINKKRRGEPFSPKSSEAEMSVDAEPPNRRRKKETKASRRDEGPASSEEPPEKHDSKMSAKAMKMHGSSLQPPASEVSSGSDVDMDRRENAKDREGFAKSKIKGNRIRGGDALESPKAENQESNITVASKRSREIEAMSYAKKRRMEESYSKIAAASKDDKSMDGGSRKPLKVKDSPKKEVVKVDTTTVVVVKRKTAKKKSFLGISGYRNFDGFESMALIDHPDQDDSSLGTTGESEVGLEILEKAVLEAPPIPVIPPHLKAAVEEYRKKRCLPLYAIEAASDENSSSSKTQRYMVDFQIGLFFGLKHGRDLLDKYPHIKTRIATGSEKSKLEQSPLAETILECCIAQGRKWIQRNDAGTGYKLQYIDVHFIKVEDVMELIQQAREDGYFGQEDEIQKFAMIERQSFELGYNVYTRRISSVFMGPA